MFPVNVSRFREADTSSSMASCAQRAIRLGAGRSPLHSGLWRRKQFYLDSFTGIWHCQGYVLPASL